MKAKGHDYYAPMQWIQVFILSMNPFGLDPVAIADLIQLLADEKQKKIDFDEYPRSGFG